MILLRLPTFAICERDRKIAEALNLMIAEARAAAGNAAEQPRDPGDDDPELAPVV